VGLGRRPPRGGVLGDVVEFLRSVIGGKQAPEAKVDRGGGDAITAYHFASPGDDSQPLPGDVAYLAPDDGTGTAHILGYQDPETTPVAEAGEKRIYARSGPGTLACEVWLKADGSVVISNDVGSVTLGPGGTLRAENSLASAELTTSGFTVQTLLGTFGATTHTHTTPWGPSGPPIPGT
jgi:hypothetical protein